MTHANAWHIDNIEWQETSANGTKSALLEGRRDLPGRPFTHAFFIPAGFWDLAHWHSADARVAVLRGALHLGYGDVHNASKLSIYRAGSYVIVSANARHFDGSDEDTLSIGTAVGRWTMHYIDASAQPSAGTTGS